MSDAAAPGSKQARRERKSQLVQVRWWLGESRGMRDGLAAAIRRPFSPPPINNPPPPTDFLQELRDLLAQREAVDRAVEELAEAEARLRAEAEAAEAARAAGAGVFGAGAPTLAGSSLTPPPTAAAAAPRGPGSAGPKSAGPKGGLHGAAGAHASGVPAPPPPPPPPLPPPRPPPPPGKREPRVGRGRTPQ